jgi:hypothetical protein
MAWQTWTPTGTAVAIKPSFASFGELLGVYLIQTPAPGIDAVLGAPMTKGLITIADTRFVSTGSVPEFPMVPKWRKTKRLIG